MPRVFQRWRTFWTARYDARSDNKRVLFLRALVALASPPGRMRPNAAPTRVGLMPEPYPQRERYQQHVGHGRGDHDPVDVALGAQSL
jgi:hypothetical protein